MASRRPQDARRRLQDGAKTAPSRLKSVPRRPRTLQGRPKTSQHHPKTPQDRSKTPQDRSKTPEDRSKTAPKAPPKATPPQDHSKTTSHSDLGPDLVLDTKLVPVLVHNLMRGMATDLVPISFSIRAEVRNRLDTKSGDRPGTKSDLAPDLGQDRVLIWIWYQICR